MALTEIQERRIVERLEEQMPAIQNSTLTEDEKLRYIGCIVQSTIEDFRPVYKDSIKKTVRPSILPVPDKTTLDNMAKWQRKLRESGKSESEQSLYLEDMYRRELLLQKEERS